jgi:hypothetical protein
VQLPGFDGNRARVWQGWGGGGVHRFSKNKFTSGGFSALWGCDADPITRAYIDKARNSRVEPLRVDFVQPRNASPDDARLLKREFQRVFKGYWKVGRQDGEDALFATVTRSQFADTIKTRVVSERYNKSLARASGCPVFGALPGTWSNYDDPARVTQRSPALTHIIQGREDDRDTPSSKPLDMKPLLTFYRDNLAGGVTFNMSDFTLLPDLPPAFSAAFQRGFAKHSPEG